jgi:hypothetical protein
MSVGEMGTILEGIVFALAFFGPAKPLFRDSEESEQQPISTDPTRNPVTLYDLVGQWQFYLDSASRTVNIDFRDDGTFAQRIILNQGGIQECPGGTWSLEGALVHLTGYVTVGDGTSQSCTWRIIDTPSGLALYGGDGPDAPSFVWTRRGQPITPARWPGSPMRSTVRILCLVLIRVFNTILASLLGALLGEIVAGLISVLLVGNEAYDQAFETRPLGLPAVLSVVFWISCALIAGVLAWLASAKWIKRFTDQGITSVLRAIWRGGRLGAGLGAVMGIAAIMVILWVCQEYTPHVASDAPIVRTPVLAISVGMLVLGGLGALFGMVVGVIGFGAIAVASHLRKSRSANTDQPQGPPSADQPGG